MPIRADLLPLYGPEWENVTRVRILARAGDRCERCGKPNGQWIETVSGVERFSRSLWEFTQYWMFWRAMSSATWSDQDGRVITVRPKNYELRRLVKVVICVAHLNHTAGDDTDTNLRAMCQWCHLTHDRISHRATRQARKDACRPLLADTTEKAPRVRKPWEDRREEYLRETGRTEPTRRKPLILLSGPRDRIQ